MSIATPAEREAFYDAAIAPELVRLAKLCEENGLSFVAVAEWAPGDVGRTVTLSADRGVRMSVLELAARTGDNVDALVMGLMKHARTHGHSSAILSQLGVPNSPVTEH